MNTSRYACPKCGATRTQRCQVAYEQSSTVGDHSDSERLFASRVAPPRMPSWIFPAIALAVGLYQLLDARDLIGAIFFLGLAGLLTLRWRARRPKYLADMALYPSLWVCLACGHIFKPD